MITSVYIDNYKCYSNASIELGGFNLMMGENGSGKTALFEVLDRIKRLVTQEEKVDVAFPQSTMTRWDQRSTQTFELRADVGKTSYTYKLVVEHNRDEENSRVQSEILLADEHTIFSFEMGDVQLYRDDYSEGPSYPFDWGRSALAMVMPRGDNQLLTQFKERLKKVYVIRMYPPSMAAESKSEAQVPSTGFENFTSWYRHASQEQPQSVQQLFEDLSGSLEGFVSLKMAASGGQSRTMDVTFSHDGENGAESVVATYSFDELSDGQRAVIVLYALTRFVVDENATLCIDEPGNYLGIDEVKPWLMELEEVCSDKDSQVCLVSHHPKLIDALALSRGLLFSRAHAGPVRTREVQPQPVEAISVSELMPRGWLDE